MMIRYERPISQTAFWARRLARFSFGFLAVALLAHRFGPLTTPHFLVLCGISAGLALVAVVFAVIGFVRLWQVAAVGGIAAFMALVYSAGPLGFAGVELAAYFSRPAIYDVSTDTQSPPSWIIPPDAEQGWLRRAAEVTAEDRAAQRAAYPGLTGRRYDGALDRVYQGVRNVVEKTGVGIAAEEGLENTKADLEDLVVKPETGPRDSEPDSVPIPLSRPDMIVPGDMPQGRRQSDVLLQGEWRTLITGLRFDVLIRLREEAETTLVDLRVASRYGPHDLGIGAAFAESFLKALDAELLGIAGG